MRWAAGVADAAAAGLCAALVVALVWCLWADRKERAATSSEIAMTVAGAIVLGWGAVRMARIAWSAL